MALVRGPCRRQSHTIGRALCLLQHEAPAGAPAVTPASPAVPELTVWAPSCKHTFNTGSACHATRRPSQPNSRSARSSALTTAERKSSVDKSADPWTEVVHKESGQIYYWNEDTNETTALGELKPGPEGRQLAQRQVAVGRGTSLLGLVGVGAGIGLTFALIGRLLGG